MRQKAVLFLLDYLPRSWESRDEFHFRLSKRLIQRGLQPIFFFSGTLPEAVSERFRSIGAQVHAASYGPDRKAYIARIRTVCSEYDVRLVHVRYFNYFSLLPWMARRFGVRKIIFTEANSGELKAGGWKLSVLKLRTMLTTFPVSRVIAISQYVRNGLVRAGVPESKLRVVYKGIDESAHGPNPSQSTEVRKQYGVRPEELLLLIVADFRPMKNHETVLEALAALDVPAKLLVAGDGPLRDHLKARAAELGISDRVVWLGYFHGPQKLMQGSDVFLLPSTGEAFGFSIAEAMCCGLPVIGADSGAIPEIIRDGETGYVVPPRDPKGLAAAIRRLAEDPALREQMGAAGRARVEANFAMDLSVNSTLEVYDEIWG
jgi:glycosyltransferase involved in cell wall biosynthesis